MFSAVESFSIETWEKDFLELINKASKLVSVQPILLTLEIQKLPYPPGDGREGHCEPNYVPRLINADILRGVVELPKPQRKGRLALERL